VVVATLDPYPLVDGRGVMALREAGVEVEVGVLEEEAARQNAGFLKHVRTGVPFVTLKMAASLDGKSAARDGSSRWITGEPARREVHAMRAATGAIVVGSGTAVRDDPSLTVRHPDHPDRAPLRVVVDGRGVVPATARLFTDGAAPTLVATTAAAPEDRRRAWSDAGAEVLVLGGEGRVEVAELMAELGKVLFLAPILVGGRDASSVLMGSGIPSIADPHRLRIVSIERVGDDIKVVADVHRDR
jgi:diaminohydroxyphosphoribosylaminopyrimidine deaminase/5-amino-6-(5-phosphoribosylamino)uracil reductase